MAMTVSLAQDITIAWATPVSVPHLGAGLTAYVETKAAITTFRLALKYSALTVCQNLPEEIKIIIASEVQEIVLQRQLKKWARITMCLFNKCNYERGEHFHNIERFHCGLTDEPKGGLRIQKCIQIFSEDFNIRPLFMVAMVANGNDFTLDAKAFLTLPLKEVSLSSGYDYARFVINEVLDLSLLTSLTEELIERFGYAMKALRIHPYAANEDNSVYEGQTLSCDAIADCYDYEDIEWVYDDNGSNGTENDSKTSSVMSLQDQDHDGDKDTALSEPLKHEVDNVGENIVSKTKGKEREAWPKLMVLGRGTIEADCDCDGY